MSEDKQVPSYSSLGTRFFIVGLLVLLMFIPLFFVGLVINDRKGLQRSTVQSIGEEWGGAQTVSGPQLIVPVGAPVTVRRTREVVNTDTQEVETQSFDVT